LKNSFAGKVVSNTFLWSHFEGNRTVLVLERESPSLSIFHQHLDKVRYGTYAISILGQSKKNLLHAADFLLRSDLHT